MEETLLLPDQAQGGGFFSFFDSFGSFLQEALFRFGDNPLLAMWWLILHGGWIALLFLAAWVTKQLWLGSRAAKGAASKQWVLLAIDIPKLSEQTVKAVDNMFAHLAGGHSGASWLDIWWNGFMQDTMSFEIVSIEGQIQYLVRTTTKLRDLLEASIYAQYPDAEITEVEDYTSSVPMNYPDENYELFGTEWIPVKSDVYPLKTYIDFEHSLTAEFKDPLAVLLEGFSRLGPGEQAWYQIVVEPCDQKEYVEKVNKEILKLKGEKIEAKKSMLEKAVDLPLKALNEVADVAIGGSLGGGAPADKPKDFMDNKMMRMSPGERRVLEAVERKASHIQHFAKIRFIYVGRKEVFSKSKILQSIVGAVKQYNTNDMQSLKPELKRVGVSSGIFFFKDRRNNDRKGKIVRAYRDRSMWAGADKYYLSTEELASLWHLPVVTQVRAPQVKKTEAKKAEPPMNLPFA